MPLRILVVDDFEPFRRHVRSMLAPRTDFQIIGEASDGMDAVQKAAELQPDLILLDISLPRLNGLEAARRIRILAPSAKILVISQESSFDVIATALRSGALGYVHKLHAVRDLLPPLDAVGRDGYFVSNVLKQKSSQTGDEPPRHEVQFYSDDASLLDGFTDFAVTQLQAGKAVIIVATEPHRAGVLQRLSTRSVGVDRALASGTLTVLDTADTLSRVMTDGAIDPDQFFEVIGKLVETANWAAPRVAACGELAPQLLATGQTVQALRLEQLWDVAAHGFGLDTLCGYSLENVDRSTDIFRSICAEHSRACSR